METKGAAKGTQSRVSRPEREAGVKAGGLWRAAAGGLPVGGEAGFRPRLSSHWTKRPGDTGVLE